MRSFHMDLFYTLRNAHQEYNGGRLPSLKHFEHKTIHLALDFCCRSCFSRNPCHFILFSILLLTFIGEYGVVGRGDMSYIFMLCNCRLNKCSISYWQSIMNFNTIKQQIEIIIMKNRWLYSLLLVSIIYLVLFYYNFTAYIGDYLEEEKYGFCIHCNGSVMCGTCKCARTLLHWIVKWWRLSLLHTLCFYFD